VDVGQIVGEVLDQVLSRVDGEHLVGYAGGVSPSRRRG
jgi:hypothetical protein